MAVDLGRCNAPPKKLVVRFFANAKAKTPTQMAPPMTKASEGSHDPARSRKPMILLGSVIPERIRPMLKIKPTANSVRRWWCMRFYF